MDEQQQTNQHPSELELTPEEQERFQKKMQEILEYYTKEGGERGIKHSIKFNRLAMRVRGGKKKQKKNNANNQ